MTTIDQQKYQLALDIDMSAIAQEKKDALMRKLATASDAAGLEVVKMFCNAYQMKSQASAESFIEEYNEHIGLIRIAGRAEFLIKAPKERTGTAPVETWKNAIDAKNYLRRLGLKTYEERFYPGSKRSVRIDCFNEWQGSPSADCYSGVTYRPNGSHKVNGQFNLWQGWGATPSPGDKHVRFLALLKDGFCNGNKPYYDYVISYLAHMMQKPEKLPGTALVIHSGQGTGKGTFIEAITAMIGTHNSSGDVSTKDLMGGFNSKLAHALLININEATFSGNHDQIQFMKKLTTDPYIRCEYKGYEPFDFPNYSRQIITTNNVNWGQIALDDRRYLVLEPGKAFKENHAFFKAFRKDMFEDGGVENLMHYLLEFDISQWNPETMPVRSTGIDTLIESMNGESPIKFFFDLAGTGYAGNCHANSNEAPPISCGNTVTFQALYRAYIDYCKESSLLMAQGQTKFSKTIQSLGMFVKRNAGTSQVKLLPMEQMRQQFKSTYLEKWHFDWDTLFDGSPVEPDRFLEGLEDEYGRMAPYVCDESKAKVLAKMMS